MSKKEHVKAITYREIVPKVGCISYIKYSDISEKTVNNYKQLVEKETERVILPVEYSIEQYSEKIRPIAGYCHYESISIEDSVKTKGKYNCKIGFHCTNRCRILDIIVEDNGDIYVDIEILENQPFEPEHDSIRGIILSNFKEYLKYKYVSVQYIQNVKNAKNIDDLIKWIVLSLQNGIQDEYSRKLIEEEDSLERLNILDVAVEVELYEARSDKGSNEIAFYKSKINKLKIDENIKSLIYDEFVRLKSYRRDSSEHADIVDWLDRVLKLPWDNAKEINKDVELAKQILNNSHYGMNKLKEKILEYIALNIITNKMPSSILCLYGPPGVGKSTIAKSIAKALNKDFYAISLGGVTNPTELYGMKRFYVGAKAGRIIEGIANAGSNNCVLLLDEIDKMAVNGYHGDPYAVLLEIFDKNQNKEFKDKYLDIPFDISNVMFITTANTLKTIPEPLLNRLEVINIEGYSTNEKIHIAQNYIIDRTKKSLGVENIDIKISDGEIRQIIENYTFESGVRELERAIETICRKSIIENCMHDKEIKEITINYDKIKEYLGDIDCCKFNTALEGEIGVVNKMSVSGPVGEIGRLEISLVNGTGEVVLSDNLIGTAKSTFKTVFGLIMSNAEKWNIDTTIFKNKDFYIHSTHHSINHDGPSGGVADVICLLSAIKNISISQNIAFTGEIALKGKVLAIGGIKEKLLAAQRYKMEKVVIPLDNKPEVDKLSHEIIGNLKIEYVNTIDDVYSLIFNEK